MPAISSDVAPAVWERRVLDAIAARVFRSSSPGDDDSAHAAGLPEGWPPVAGTHTSDQVAALVARLGGAERRELRLFLRAIEWGGPLRVARPGLRFTLLDGDDQDAVLRFLSEGPIRRLRGAFAALKSLLCLGYFSDPRAWGAMGYDGPRDDRPADRASSPLIGVRRRPEGSSPGEGEAPR